LYQVPLVGTATKFVFANAKSNNFERLFDKKPETARARYWGFWIADPIQASEGHSAI
jgi:hypothetical protein